MKIDLSGSSALVTGATAGIGRATALALAELGARVVVHGRDPERGADTVARIAAVGGRARFVTADLSDADAVRGLAADAGEVDILVNNAAVFQFTTTPDTDTATFDLHVEVNLRAPFLLVQALVPAMVRRGRGAVVNVSSGAATVPGPGGGVYGGTKAALELLTKSWAAEFGPRGVRVNAVAAGPTRTEGTAAFGAGFEEVGRFTALGRLAEPEEIAAAVTFLASPAAGYVNGAVLQAIGGMPATGG
ncbi:SDR family NAD(P)-dependent oxidoreductase [Saccharothrix coeruleofusca]|uniref:Short-chain dehydrogenase n=1 Tax=Saccharothrix coeruleofusca TaxID=33919 RepID=A0A918AS66_9PSEU|nr:SDR family oxidoreductase [Saccharothrix coeruleofusca]GGP76598.1 short-chain dehydrogenase [Saccharothrix coeruleofusca]